METPSDRLCILLAPRLGGAETASLFGLAAVERTVLGFQRAGVRQFLLIGDPDAVRRVRELLARGRCRHARVRVVDSLPTTLAGDERVYLARTDCLYDRRLIARFVSETRRAVDSAVAVDFRKESAAASTLPRVAAWSGALPSRVRTVGRHLVGADGVLVGLALATPGWVRSLGGEAPAERAWLETLAAVAAREPVETWAVSERWHEVRDEGQLPTARRQVLASSVGISDGPVARHLNRPISLRITERLLAAPVKPWQVTFASFVCTLAAGLGFAVGHAATGGLLAQLAAVLDGVDGELARVRYSDSAFAGVYDALLDRVGDAVLIGGMTLYAWIMGAGREAVVLGFFAVAGSSLSMLVKEKYGTQFQEPFGEEADGRWRWLLLGRDGRLFLALIAGVTGQVEAVLAYLAVGTHVHAGARIVRIRALASRA